MGRKDSPGITVRFGGGSMSTIRPARAGLFFASNKPNLAILAVLKYRSNTQKPYKPIKH